MSSDYTWPPGATSRRLGMEVVVQQCILALQDLLPAKIAELATWAGDGVELAMPADELFIPAMLDPRYLSGYPALLVYPEPSRRKEHDIGDEYTIGHQFTVDVVEAGADALDITTRLFRWGQIVFECLAQNVLPAGHTEWDDTGWPQPRGTSRSSGDFVQDLPVTFTCTTYEWPNPDGPQP